MPALPARRVIQDANTAPDINQRVSFKGLPEEHLVQLLGERGEQGGQGEHESAEDGR